MVTKEEVLEFLKSEGNKTFLKDNSFQTEVEKKIEIPAQITDEAVTKFISDNQGYRDKLHNSIETDFLKRKTGLEEIKPEMLGEKLFLESGVKTNNESYKKALIEANMTGVKNPELLIGLIDGSKVEFKDGKLEGFGEQYEGLKTRYPDMFEPGQVTPPNTPPAGGGTPPVEVTYDQFIGMSKEEKRNLPEETLQKLMNE